MCCFSLNDQKKKFEKKNPPQNDIAETFSEIKPNFKIILNFQANPLPPEIIWRGTN